MEDISKLSKSKQTAAKTLHKALEVLKNSGGSLPSKEVMEKIGQDLDLSDWEKERYEKSGYIRWQSILHFYTIGALKAGYLTKNRGTWFITPEGEEALKMEPADLLLVVDEAYRKWAKENVSEEEVVTDLGGDIVLEQQNIEANLQQLEGRAHEGLIEYIKSKNPYEFQDMVAALLEAMGYYISFIAPKGRDGGLDVVVYSDPLGAKEPRIKVQVKHRPESSIGANDIRALLGLLNKTGDVGLFVTSGNFSPDAVRFARDSHQHIDLIDIQKFVTLWQDFYSKMTDESKEMMPLRPIYFLGN
ncbi:MAG: hypothetical protein ACD_22C00256G0020 [uncultured bacterium]|uniref:Restriction endonuclease n=1 Tax=candidate division WWE3 bacterium RBG_16_37_10 TaxID=1802610 RepID=A0A1F4UXU6_UNCKA|nr:MAG: hypothetical protein ACD_22C00256G0020 [uncultured bacterium]OGC49722.1 MAG: restriction endonuclease [candidate division WWE3 bacterium RBG_16_37_10]